MLSCQGWNRAAAPGVAVLALTPAAAGAQAADPAAARTAWGDPDLRASLTRIRSSRPRL